MTEVLQMLSALIVLMLAGLSQAPPPNRPPIPPMPRPSQPSLRVESPSGWVAFSADVRVVYPGQAEKWGRYVQDEHGCQRQEMFYPDGAAMVTLLNFETMKMYRLSRSSWTSQPMKLGLEGRRPLTQAVHQKAEPIEGFDAYISEIPVRSPRGDYVDRPTVIPSLNFFRAVWTTPGGETRTAVNIKVGPQSHDQFLPPPGAAIAEQPGFSGFMSMSAVVLRIAFGGQPPTEITTSEETAFAIKTPSGLPLTIVTTVTDWDKNIVRIRVLNNAKGPAGNVQGDLLDDVTAALGATVETTRLGENLTITVRRIRDRVAR